MKWTDNLLLPWWISLPLRLALYGGGAFIAFNLIMNTFNIGSVNNQMDCSDTSSKKAKGLEYAKNMAACLKQKNGPLKNWWMRSTFRTIDALPNAPKEFVGTWDASQPGCTYRYTLEENGKYSAEQRQCHLAGIGVFPSYSGDWGVHNEKMIWLDNNFMVWPPDINPIERIDGDTFILVERNGSRTEFSRLK
ncbi:MAG: hypothetical protein LBI59_07670 [Candidatus Accumulibacter sp.]|jgi:hypothetical protein|nr:hypothetical protein [Accumulibacter sp.]